MQGNKIKTTQLTLSTINVGVEQREPSSPHAGNDLLPEARDASTSITDDKSIEETSNTNDIAVSVHEDIPERVTVELEAVPTLDSDSPPVPLQMIIGQAEDVLLQEKYRKSVPIISFST